MDVSGQIVYPGHFTSREKGLVSIELDSGWVLQLVWMDRRRDSSVASAKIWTPDLPAYILVIVLTVLPDIDLKIIHKSILIERDGRFGLVCLIHDSNSWNASLYTFISIKLCKMCFHVVNHV